MAKASSIVLCDTNILIEAFRNNKLVIEEFDKIKYENIAISVITIAELLFGARNKQEYNEIRRRIDKIRIFSIDTDISNIFHKLVEDYSLSHSIGIADSLIAATSLSHNIKLFTLNIKDFHFIPDLVIHSMSTGLLH